MPHSNILGQDLNLVMAYTHQDVKLVLVTGSIDITLVTNRRLQACRSSCYLSNCFPSSLAIAHVEPEALIQCKYQNIFNCIPPLKSIFVKSVRSLKHSKFRQHMMGPKPHVFQTDF